MSKINMSKIISKILKTKINLGIFLIVLGLVVIGVIAFIVKAQNQDYSWTAPNSSPPSGNVPPPINVGGDDQKKSGSIISEKNIIGAVVKGTCTGRTLVGLTPSGYSGSLGGYRGANNKCNSYYEGSVMCTSKEILESINCLSTEENLLPSSGVAWVSIGVDLPVSGQFVNDCEGWTFGSNSSNKLGAIWIFDSYGGKISTTYCSQSQKIACCR